MDKIKIHFTLERFDALFVCICGRMAAKNLFTHAFILDDEVLVIDIVIGNNLTCTNVVVVCLIWIAEGVSCDKFN